MGRSFLPENQGMLFHYTPPLCPKLWTFNCYIDLSVAFLDENQVIFSICNLYAYPERMDPQRPVRNVQDMALYPYSDPIVQFFLEKSVGANAPTSYVLEMNHGWFKRNGIKIGDHLEWNGCHGIFTHPKYTPAINLPL
jgi:hypothetical protein